MSDAWKQFEGQAVNDKFPLLQFLGGSERNAVFLTERHEDERLLKTVIKLVPAAGEEDDLRLSRWQSASELSHPHLISLYEWGRCELGNASFLYITMEYAEENLAQILPGRALTTDEARLMLDPVLDVIAYLHGKGFVHGGIKPANILANDDYVKVSCDGLRRGSDSTAGAGRSGSYDPPEEARGVFPAVVPASPAGDVWSLGMTLVEALTQHLPAQQTEGQRAPQLPQDLPDPFLDIARHCLVWHPQGRWTILQVAARLQGRTPVSHAVPEVRRPQTATQPSGKRQGYAAAVGIGLVLAVVLVGARLLHRHSEAPQPLAVVLEQPAIAPVPTPKQETLAKQTEGAGSSATAGRQASAGNGNVPLLASDHGESGYREEPSAIAKQPAATVVRGEVIHQVLPEVLQSARDTIRGTVRVSVTVDVDRSGNVEGAELQSSGPSKYFARQALQAAQLWKFEPPKVAGRNVLSSWTLRFEFASGGITVVPTQEIP